MTFFKIFWQNTSKYHLHKFRNYFKEWVLTENLTIEGSTELKDFLLSDIIYPTVQKWLYSKCRRIHLWSYPTKDTAIATKLTSVDFLFAQERRVLKKSCQNDYRNSWHARISSFQVKIPILILILFFQTFGWCEPPTCNLHNFCHEFCPSLICCLSDWWKSEQSQTFTFCLERPSFDLLDISTFVGLDHVSHHIYYCEYIL